MIVADRSRCETWAFCPRLYYYEYVHGGLGLDLDEDKTAADIGSCVHEGVGRMITLSHLDIPDFPAPEGVIPLLTEGLKAAAVAPEWAILPTDEDRDLVEALVRTWFVAGLPLLSGWEVMSVEQEEHYDYTVPSPPLQHWLDIVKPSTGTGILACEQMARPQVVRLLTRSDWIARASGSEMLKGAPVAPGVYNWNLKTWRTCDDRRVKALDYDAQLSTELLGPEVRLGTRLAGNVWDILIKENHPLVWCWRSAKRGDVAHRFNWHCDASHMNTHKAKPDLCPGDKWHRLGDDYEKVPVKEAYGSQAVAFDHLMATDPAILADFHRILGPYPRRSQWEIDEWLESQLGREARLAAVRSSEPLAESVLREYFPKHAGSNCTFHYGRECPAISLCWGGADPNSFDARIPNHPTESPSGEATPTPGGASNPL